MTESLSRIQKIILKSNFKWVVLFFISLSNVEANAKIDKFANDPFQVKLFFGGFYLKNNLQSTAGGTEPNSVEYTESAEGARYGVQFSYKNLFSFSSVTRGKHEVDPTYNLPKNVYIDYRFSYHTPAILIESSYLKVEHPVIGNSRDFHPEWPSNWMMNGWNISMQRTGINAFWILSPDKFSMAASFEQTERQAESGLSFVFQSSANENKIWGPLIPAEGQGHFGDADGLTEAKAVNLSISAGVGGAITLSRNFFISGIYSIGFGQGTHQYTVSETKVNGNHSTSKLDSRLTLGYNGETFFAGIKTLLDSTSYNLGSIYLTDKVTEDQFFWGFRF